MSRMFVERRPGPGALVTFWLVSIAACGPAFTPPCRIVDEATVLPGEASSSSGAQAPSDLRFLSSDRVLATWWQMPPPSSPDAGTPVSPPPVAEVAILTLDGTVAERHSVILPAASPLEADRLRSAPFLWTGDGIAQVHPQGLPFDDASGAPHVRQWIRVERFALDGTRHPPVDLTMTECVDCILRVSARPVKDDFAVLYADVSRAAPGPLPVDPVSLHYLTLSRTGEVVYSGKLEGLVGRLDQTFGSFFADPHPDLLVLGAPASSFLADESFAVRAGPFQLEDAFSSALAWSPDVTEVFAGWVQILQGNVLAQRFGAAGSPSWGPRRISSATLMNAAARGPSLSALVFTDLSESASYLAVSRQDGRKLGGDIRMSQPLPSGGGQPAGGAPLSRGVLVAEENAAGFIYFGTSGEGLRRVHVTCEAL